MGRLILKRRRGQAIVVNGPAVIRISDDHHGYVRLLIDAPAETRVDREEVAEARKQEAKP